MRKGGLFLLRRGFFFALACASVMSESGVAVVNARANCVRNRGLIGRAVAICVRRNV